MKTVVIGSGLSGLVSAALLANAGAEVEVFEQNNVIGGVTAPAQKNGYSWEQGPLLLGGFLPGENAYELLEELGIALDTVREDRGIVMPDYDMWHPEEYEGPYWRREKLKKLFPGDARGIDSFYRFSDDVLLLSFLANQLEKRKNPVLKLRMLLAYLKVKKYETWTAEQVMCHFFKNPKIQALFTGILADICVRPSEFQGLGIPFSNIETAFDKRIPLEVNGEQIRLGYCYIKGGVVKIVEELSRVIAAKGGKIHTDAAVEKVLVENGKVTGIRLKGNKTVNADIVIGSGGGREMFYDLVGKEHLSEEYLKILETYRPMEAVFMVHLGVDFDPLKYQKAALCYYYETYDIEGAVGKLSEGIYHEGADGFLIYVPSKITPEMAPEGHHAVTIYTICPDTLRDGSWEEKKEYYADGLIKLAEKYLPGLSSHITEKLIMTPVEYRKLTHLKKSSFGGVIPLMGVKNPPHITPVEGLYFVGAQSESAGGVATVMMGAKNAFREIKKKYGI